MNIYTQLEADFGKLSFTPLWPEMRQIFEQAVSGTPRYWRMPVIASESVGGTAQQAMPAVVAIACAHIGIVLIDDLLDQDPKGAHHHLGEPATANLASAFQLAGFEALAQGDAKPEAKLAALHSLAHMILATAQGQYWDAQNSLDEAFYWRVTQTKSSPFFGAALHLGALLGGAPAPTAEALKILGHLYGEMIQIHDDLNDAMETPANPDWVLGRSPLPILFAQVVDHPDRERFLELRRETLEADKLAEAQAILIRCGAMSYCFDQILFRYHQAREMLKGIPLAAPREVEDMLDVLVRPIDQLFRSLGLASPS